MRYLIPLIFVACNSGSVNKKVVIAPPENTITDSISLVLDSLKNGLEDLKDVSDYAKAAQVKIARLEKLEREKQKTEKEIEVYPTSINSLDYQKDDRDKVIAELKKKVYEYEREIATLKNQLFREQVKVPAKEEIEKPDDKSLVITLMGALEKGASVWIMESNRKSKKIMKGYYNCQTKDLNSLGAKEAKRYKDVYFFNDVPTGKYLIKVCALYGDWVEVKRKDGYQTVAMQVAPPIQ